MDPLELAVPGLRLRPWHRGDAVALLQALLDPAIALWNPAPSPEPDLADAQAWIDNRSDWTGPEHASFAIVADGDGDLLGSVSLFDVDRTHRHAEIGYWTTPRARGRGIATLALRIVAEWAFTRQDLHRIQLFHAVENPASCRVASNAGFRIEGTLREVWRYGDGRLHDDHLHARLASDEHPTADR